MNESIEPNQSNTGDISTSAVLFNIFIALIYCWASLTAKGSISGDTATNVFLGRISGAFIALLAMPFVVGGVVGIIFGAKAKPRTWFSAILGLLIYFHFRGTFTSINQFSDMFLMSLGAR
jgi:hypothetical protein